MRSGIGPQRHLRVRAANQQHQRIRFNPAAFLGLAHSSVQDVGIPVLVDLPVGENLQDHVMVPITIKSKSFPPLQSDSARISCALVQPVLCV